jgi:RND family efflux transporter, MFP subunit
MKKASILIVVFAVLLGAVVLSFLVLNRTSAVDEFSTAPAEISGSVEATETDVNVKIPGRISSIIVEEGQEITAGQTIAVMEADNIEAKSHQAEAVLDLAQSTYDRMNQLYQDGVLPQQKLDMARTDLRQAQAAYEEVQSYLNDSTVKAPISGIIFSKSVEKGEIVSSGMPLVTITDLKDVWLSIKVRESAINQFKVGAKVPVQILGVPHKAYPGTVTYIAAKPSYATERAIQEKGEKDLVAFQVKIKLSNSDSLLRPGMTGTVSVKP